MKKVICLILLFVVVMVGLTGCYRQSERVSYNIGKQADNFNVTRRLAVLNARTDKPIFELVGKFSLKNNSTNELEVICEVAPGEYKKHFVYLNQWTIYVVEDVSGANVSQYHYEVNFLPEMFIPYTFTMND
jgi:hypothetical protein